ncbi:hypothetical protein BGZ73_005191 [Actinomortierella ambigua]|nr:hypothetical protein BGZ73_005191 [Actinomortierella ambigua]
MENTDDAAIKQSIQEQTPDSNGSAAPEDTSPSHDTLTPSHDSSVQEESATPASMEGLESSMPVSESGAPAIASGAEKPPAPEAPPRRRPRRTGQPLHLLLQDCARQHITANLCKKSVDEIKAVLASKQSIAADLQQYSNEFVLHTARDRVISEVDNEGRELLQDVDPSRDIIKQRFEDETMVFKSYDDAIHDIRVDLYEAKDDATLISGATKEELNNVFQVWDPLYKRPEPETRRGGRTHVGPYPTRGGRPGGPPSTRPHPYGGRAPYRDPRGEPRGEPRGDARGDPRGYHHEPRDYPYRDDYYGERMEDYRRADYDRRDPRGPPPPPGARNSPYPPPRDMRDGRDYRERPSPPASRHDDPYGVNRYEDRRRGYDGGQPAPGPRDGRPGMHHGASPSLASHPSLPPKPAVSAYMPGVQNAPPGNRVNGRNQPQAPHQPPQQPTHAPAPAQPQAYPQTAAAYPGYAQQAAGYSQGYADPNAYAAYGYYGQDPNAAATAAAQQAYYGQAGWDMTHAAAANVAAVGAVAGAGLNLQPFTSSQHGRHKAVPLPTDFMSGPSEAPRLTMPEPHEVLGVIRGVIIRDAQGNIGLSQYTFTRSS